MSINSFKTHRFILIFVVSLELIFGTIFLYKYCQQIKYKKEQEQLKKITFIDKKTLLFPEIEEFNYYWEYQPNITVVNNPYWLGHEVKYTYNADGLNERFDYEIEKPENTFRIITLGDSFTFGNNVNTEENWTEILEDMLNKSKQQICDYKKFEVINLGLGGGDIPYIVKRYQDIGAKYHPDLIIWFESGSGFIRFVEKEQVYEQDCLEEYEKNNISVDEKLMFHPCLLKADQYFINLFSNRYDQLNTELINKLNEFLDTLNPKKSCFFHTLRKPSLLRNY